MSFDEQPDGDPHGECAAEIHRLNGEHAYLIRVANDAVEENTKLRTRCADVVSFMMHDLVTERIAHERLRDALNEIINLGADKISDARFIAEMAMRPLALLQKSDKTSHQPTETNEQRKDRVTK